MRYVITVQEQPATWAELSTGAKIWRCLSVVVAVGMVALMPVRR